MALPPDYAERVYAGVLGKIIGVYLGGPIETWTYDRIMSDLGEIEYYVNDRLGERIVVTDDDITGTFTLVRALADTGFDPAITSPDMAEAWLNYTIEERSIFRWGGFGNSTEHTAYLRLKAGVPAPASGSMALNGQTVAEQIGGQIFIDGWAMVAPGDPERAVELARRAASVSHDGEAIYGAQSIAAMESLAFVEPDTDRLLDCAMSLIPDSSVIHRMIGDIRDWHGREPSWQVARQLLEDSYGYDRYGGNVHVVPNHGLVILALLYGRDDFGKTLGIVNTCGWDTDCNSGNLGCLMGIKLGLAGIDAGRDWRGPIADRMYLPTADGGRAITDAVIEATHLIAAGRALAGVPPMVVKGGARFTFQFDGSLQGFRVNSGAGGLTLANSAGTDPSERMLAFRYTNLVDGRAERAGTPTFIPPDDLTMPGYALDASPTLFPGQSVSIRFLAATTNASSVSVRPYISTYNADDSVGRLYHDTVNLEAAADHVVTWQIPDTHGAVIHEIGLELSEGADGTVFLDYLTWSGAPDVEFRRPDGPGVLWSRAWVKACDRWDGNRWPESFRILQNRGTGMITQGTSDWVDYSVKARVRPHMAQAVGIVARAQGLRRHYALTLEPGPSLRLTRSAGADTVMGEVSQAWQFEEEHELELDMVGSRIRGSIDGRLAFDVVDDDPLPGGAAGLLCREGRLDCDAVQVAPSGGG